MNGPREVLLSTPIYWSGSHQRGPLTFRATRKLKATTMFNLESGVL